MICCIRSHLFHSHGSWTGPKNPIARERRKDVPEKSTDKARISKSQFEQQSMGSRIDACVVLERCLEYK